MPVAVTEIPAGLDIPRKRWTRAEFDALADCGALEWQELELVEGELINKMGKKRPHVTSATRLQKLLVAIFGFDYVNPEPSIDVSPQDNPTSEPMPDLIVLSRDPLEVTDRNPRPDELALVAEIADTTLDFDLSIKAGLYARAGIVEYWVQDVTGRRIIVHRDPREGRHQSVLAYGSEESVAPLSAPNSPIRVKDSFLQ
jgi:Uma2 family endonuclease